MSTWAASKSVAAAAAALLLLNASLTFANVWPTPYVRLPWSVSLEVAAVLLLLAAWRGRRPAPSARFLRTTAIIWVLLVIGRYAQVTTRSLYGRDINLYWDLRNIPDVGAMLAFVARPAVLALVVAAVVLVPLILYLPLRWALGQVTDAAGHRQGRRVLAIVALLMFAISALQGKTNDDTYEGARFPLLPSPTEPVTFVFAEQVAKFVGEVSGATRRALPPAPVLTSTLAEVKGADVFVIFIESYGAVSWDRPAFADALAGDRAALASAIRDTGRGVVSGFAESPTFGGKSWLAHISLLSGTQVKDENTNEALMREHRDTIVTTFAREGYRTAAVMPGLQRPWPEGKFYGFQEIYGLEQLAYRGPTFGWWDITDQFVFARMDQLLVASPEHRPVFAFVPTISTHTPFRPAPPYQPDWVKVLGDAPFTDAELKRVYQQVPDWENLGPGYVEALAYVHQSLAGYLRLRYDRDFVLVLLGDHQPPAAVSGEGATWDVPVHVIASRPGILERLRRHGFRDGLEPQRPEVSTISGLATILLDAFGGP